MRFEKGKKVFAYELLRPWTKREITEMIEMLFDEVKNGEIPESRIDDFNKDIASFNKTMSGKIGKNLYRYFKEKHFEEII